MQKLIFTNKKGDSVDLTSGFFGITKWSGFSNVNQTNQTQTVPFVDGSIYLDSLLNERSLTVTLAINDENDLYKRYELRRMLIKILNPKLGEGYLIYKNNFTEKRIKVIAQTPIFPDHNSNTKGTYKANLTWIACDPYWEDLEETKVFFGITKQPIIINNGDVPAKLKIDFFTTGVTNPKITNITANNKFIEFDGDLNKNLQISTEVGNKYFKSEKLNLNKLTNFDYDLRSVTYSESLGLFVAVSIHGLCVSSSDGVNWNGGNGTGCSVTYSESLGLFVAVGDDTISTSSDGVNWEKNKIPRDGYHYVRLTSVTYSENLGLFVAVGNGDIHHDILTSSDGVNWELQSVSRQYDLRSVTYSESLGLFVAVGKYNTILTSSDGVNWESQTLPATENSKLLYSVTYSENLGLFVAVGERNTILTSSDGVNWEFQTLPATENSKLLYSVTYSESLGLFVAVGSLEYDNNTVNGALILTSSDGVNWKIQNVPTVMMQHSLLSVTYSESLGLFVAVGGEWYWDLTPTISGVLIFTSSDGVNWIKQKESIQYTLYSVTYSEALNLYVAVGKKLEYRHSDVTIGMLTSSDGINWEPQTLPVMSDPYTAYDLRSVTYSESLGLFVAVGGLFYYLEPNILKNCILTSTNGIDWVVRNVPATEDAQWLYSVIYSEDLGLFVAVGGNETSMSRGILLTSSDGVNWDYKDFHDYVLESVIYSKSLGLFVAVGNSGAFEALILTSSDGVNWTEKRVEVSDVEYALWLYSVTYSESLGLFVAVGNYGLIVTSSDGVNWNIQNVPQDIWLYSVTYSESLGLFVAVGSDTNNGIVLNGIVLISSDGINWESQTIPSNNLYSITHLKSLNSFIFVGNHAAIFNSYFSLEENQIEHITSDSDVNLELELGENKFRLNKKSGSFNAKLTYRQRYIGI